MKLLIVVGEKYERLMDERIKGLHISEVRGGEHWQYIGLK